MEIGGRAEYYADNPHQTELLRIQTIKQYFAEKKINQKASFFIVVGFDKKNLFEISFESKNQKYIFSIQRENVEWDYLGEVSQTGLFFEMLKTIRFVQNIDYKCLYPSPKDGDIDHVVLVNDSDIIQVSVKQSISLIDKAAFEQSRRNNLYLDIVWKINVALNVYVIDGNFGEKEIPEHVRKLFDAEKGNSILIYINHSEAAALVDQNAQELLTTRNKLKTIEEQNKEIQEQNKEIQKQNNKILELLEKKKKKVEMSFSW